MITYLTSAELSSELTTPTTGRTLYYYLPSVSPAFLLLTDEEFEAMTPYGADNFQPLYSTHRRMLNSLMGQESFTGIPFYPVDIVLSPVGIAPWVSHWQNNPANITLFDDSASDRFILSVSDIGLPKLNADYSGSWRITPQNIINELVTIGTALEALKNDV